MIKINDWIRYEVNSKGQPAKDGDDLRAGALDYIRLKNHGHAKNRGMNKLQRVAKNRTAEVFGIFCLFLELAGNGSKENRGVLREEKDGRPATIKELAEILPATAKQIEFAVKCLSNPTVSWILADKEGFPENSGVSRKSADASRIQHNTTQHNTTQHNAPKKERYSEDFEIFWKKYPTRWIPESDTHVKIGKQLAWERWEKLSEESHRHILDIISQFKSGKAVPDPWRWLRDRKFEDYAISKPLPKPDPKIEAEQLEKERQYFRNQAGKQYREKTTDELKKMLPRHRFGWLIKEILAEREGKNANRY